MTRTALIITTGLAMMLAVQACVRQDDMVTMPFSDYEDVTFPANIAAPSFSFGCKTYLEIGAVGRKPSIKCRSGRNGTAIPLNKWSRLLRETAGEDIFLRAYTKDGGKQIPIDNIICHVSPGDIDPTMVYRLIYPGYVLWGEMGIYQRDLTSYKEKAIIRNTDIDNKTCVNCHNFAANDPEKMMIHVRGSGGATLILRDGVTRKCNPALNPTEGALMHGATYPASEASGRFIAFSSNEIQQFFHACGKKTIEVSDLEADLFVYDTQTDSAITSQDLMGDDFMETFPTWSGDSLIYFCRAAGYHRGAPLDSIRYDLCKVSFDPGKRRFGKPELVYSASQEGCSCSFPRVSPDGRWLMFTRSEYGNFSIWHQESDLVLMDLSDGSIRPIDEVNSRGTESYHSWSSDGKWFVFSSRRMDGNWTRPYIASFNPETGMCGRPFILPQKRADFYIRRMQSFNIPELVTGEVVKADCL